MLEIYSGLEAMAPAAASAVAAQLAEGLSARGRASLVATGGRSPGPVYDLLAEADLDWGRVAVTLSDERQVDVNSPEANIRQLRERLFVGQAAQAQYLPLTDYAEPALRKLMPFDAVMLGMGEDGHVASLIPGSPVMAQADGPQLLAESPRGFGSPPVARITLTFPALFQSRALFLLIAGKAKRQVVEAALAGTGADLPVCRVLGQHRVPVRIFWIPD